MIKQIKDNIWKFRFNSFGSHVYLIKLHGKNIIIDTASRLNRKSLVQHLNELNLKPEQIDIVILTHNHPDHTGNISLFKNAKIYGDKSDFPSEKINNIDNLKIKELEIIKTPGHTKGGICIYFRKEKVLFSGDTLFGRGVVGRTDFPGGSHEQLLNSLEKLKKIDYEILCPGHGIIHNKDY